MPRSRTDRGCVPAGDRPGTGRAGAAGVELQASDWAPVWLEASRALQPRQALAAQHNYLLVGCGGCSGLNIRNDYEKFAGHRVSRQK